MKNQSKMFTALKILGILWVLSFLAAGFFSMDTDFTTGNVAVIHINNIIMTSGSSGIGGTVTTSDSVVAFLDEADTNPAIKAVLLDINSPGGSGVAADEIGQRIKQMDKPVVAVIREMGASAAYWIASASDYVFANRMSLTASIGVTGSYLDFSGLIDEYNVTYQRYVSGEMKDMISPFKEDSLKEQILFQEIIDQSYMFFIEEVAQNRNMTTEEVEKVGDGRILLGKQAYELGLVDELGTKQDALHYIETTYNITAYPADFKEKVSITELLYGFTAPISGKFIKSENPILLQ